MKQLLCYFSKKEWVLWGSSILVIVVSFFLFDRTNCLSLAASLLGVTALIFIAKGNPFGQFLMILFGAFYGYISYTFSYWGEMIAFLGMSVPMAVIALTMWLRHPYRGQRTKVAVGGLRRHEIGWMLLLTMSVTFAFYFVLRALGTANLIPSTVSMATSFAAVYLTLRRSPYFALLYAVNDVVVIVLWALATAADRAYVSVLVCFGVFWETTYTAFSVGLACDGSKPQCKQRLPIPGLARLCAEIV